MSEAARQWETPTLEEIGLPKTPGLDPSNCPKEIFELYSVPSFSLNKPEIVPGSAIGSTKQLVEPGDVLLCKIVPHLVRVWCVPSRRTHRQIASGEWIVVRPEPARADGHYIRYTLIEPGFRSQFMETVSGVGGSLMRARPKAVAQIRVPLPGKIEQLRIVTKLDGLLEHSKSAREELAQIPRLIERYRQAILSAAFGGELTADWRRSHRSKVDGKQLLSALLASRAAYSGKKGTLNIYDQPEGLQQLPDSWTWCSVAILASVVSDGVHKKPDYVEHGVPFLTVRNLTAGPGITFDGCRFVTQSDHEEFVKRTNPERGDLLISKDGTLGVVRAVRTDEPFSIFVSVALVKPIDRRMTDYLELAFTSPQVQQQMVGVGTGLQHIHLTDLRRDLIPIAPPEERAEIVKRVYDAFTCIDRLEAEAIRATAILDRLDQATLAKAFSGGL